MQGKRVSRKVPGKKPSPFRLLGWPSSPTGKEPPGKSTPGFGRSLFPCPSAFVFFCLRRLPEGSGGGGVCALGSSPRYSTAGLLPVKERETRVSPTPPQPGAHRLVLWDPRDPPRRGSGSSGSMDAARFTQAVKLIN